VQDGVSGFVFTGETTREQADNFTAATLAALQRRANDPAGWTAICDEARRQRFSWELAAQRTISELYGLNHD
jgi:starch synthase